ncbi:MAG: hypothetical protein WCA84_18880 [Ignavibacteriaceae bacterium]
MIELKTREKIFYNKSGKPKSVLVDYKVYKEMLEIIEDNECIKIIEDRKQDSNISEEDFKKKIKIE